MSVPDVCPRDCSGMKLMKLRASRVRIAFTSYGSPAKAPRQETIFEASTSCKGFTDADLEAVEKLQGKMPLAQVLRCRVRYFTDCAALGGAAFIEEVFRSNRSHFGSKRSSGARRMRGADWGDLRVIRDLRHEVIT